jgi:hypothetical protein
MDILKKDQYLNTLRDKLNKATSSIDKALLMNDIYSRENYLLSLPISATKPVCDCGAKHTSFPNHHMQMCRMSQ